MKPADNIEQSIKELRRSTTAATDERILGDVLAALAASQSKPTAEQVSLFRIILRSSTTRFIAVAVIVIAALIGAVIFVGQHRQSGREIAEQKDVSGKGAVEALKEAAPDFDAKVEAELENVMAMFTAGNVDGLVKMLSEGQLVSKLAAAYYLAGIGDLRAAKALEKLNAELGDDDPNNAFAAAAAKIKTRLKQEKREAGFARADKSESASRKRPGVRAKMKDERRNIQGWLIDANDNPVNGTVTLGAYTATTKDDGSFIILQPTYKDSMSSFGQAFDAGKSLGCLFIWEKNDEVNDVEIIVEPLASISGFVVDKNANPISDFELEMSVFIKGDLVYNGDIENLSWETRITPDGFFEVNYIPIGVPLQLALRKPGFEKLIKLENLISGQNLDMGQITFETVQGFDEDAQRSCSLAGFVVDENNEPLKKISITAHAGEEKFEIETNADGWYEFKNLPAGAQIKLVPYSDGYGHSPFNYTCSEANNELDIQLFPAAYDWYGKLAPSLFVKEWLNTEPITLDDLKGKVVLLNIGISISNQPQFIEYICEKYKEAPFAVIAIHKYTQAGEEDKIRQFIEKYAIDFPFGIDEECSVAGDVMLPQERFEQDGRIAVPRRGLQKEGATHSLYEVKVQPAYYLIDKNGILRTSPNQTNLEEWIEYLLTE